MQNGGPERNNFCYTKINLWKRHYSWETTLKHGKIRPDKITDVFITQI